MRQLKQDSRPELDVKAAIAKLKKRKKLLEQKVIHISLDIYLRYAIMFSGEGVSSRVSSC